MDSVLVIFILFALVGLNGLFVAAEFALVTAPRAGMVRLAADGNRAAALCARIMADPRQLDRFVATAQLGITAASLGLGMYAEHAIADRLSNIGPFLSHSVASLLSVVMLSYLHLVLGEMLPKSVALGSPLRSALWLTPPVRILQFLLAPLVAVLHGLTTRVLALFGVRRAHGSGSRYYDSTDLQEIVEESFSEGRLGTSAGEVVRDLLRFGERTAGEAMVPRVRIVGIALGAESTQIRGLLTDGSHTRYPVYDNDLDHIVGIVHVKDLHHVLGQQRKLVLDDVHRVPFVPETTRLGQVVAVMRKRRTHVVIVMDEHGGTSGMLTYEDLFTEVVGSATQPTELTRPNQALVVQGTMRIEDLAELTGVTIEHEETNSVSGLILMLLGRPARVGDLVEFGLLKFEVLEVAGRGVKASRVFRPLLLSPDTTV